MDSLVLDGAGADRSISEHAAMRNLWSNLLLKCITFAMITPGLHPGAVKMEIFVLSGQSAETQSFGNGGKDTD